jgi:hypothetical protein
MATTLSSTIRESVGNLTLTIGTFSDIDDAGTWATGIPSIVGYWGNLTDDGTQTKEGIDITLTTPASGLLTFQVGENSRTGLIFVLSRS